MKQYRWCAMLCCLFGMAFMACGGTQTTGNDEMTMDSMQWCDSVTFKSGARAQVAVSCAFPEGKGALADSVRSWIFQQVGGKGVYTGSDMSKTLCQRAADMLSRDSAEVAATIKDMEYEYALCYEREINLAVTYDNDQYITMMCMAYAYLGGAHGMTSYDFATFRKSDGHKMDWELLQGMSDNQIREAIKRELTSYFNVDTVDELQECLQLDAEWDQQEYVFKHAFPLPTTPPFLTEDGVTVIYQQYEIACYAAGTPFCVITR